MKPDENGIVWDGEPDENGIVWDTEDSFKPKPPAKPVKAQAPETETYIHGGAYTPDSTEGIELPQDVADYYVSALQDPNIPISDIKINMKRMLHSQGRAGEFTGELFNTQAAEEYRKAALAGPVSEQIGYESGTRQFREFMPREDVVDPTANDVEAAFEEGSAEVSGMFTNFFRDWTNAELQGGVGKDLIRERFPDASDEQVEAIHDDMIGQYRQIERGQATYNVDQRDMNPLARFGLNTLGSMTAIDALPFGGAATRAGRVGLAATGNVAYDTALQASDQFYGAQDNWRGEQAAVAALGGAGFQGILEIGAAGLKRVLNRGANDRGTYVDVETTDGFKRVYRDDEGTVETITPEEAAAAEGTAFEGGRIPSFLENPVIAKKADGSPRSKTKKGKKGAKEQAPKELTESGRGQPLADTETRVAGLTQGWQNSPEFLIVNNVDDLDPKLEAEITADAAEGALGVTLPDGRVLLMTDNIRSPEQIDAVVFHEALGHVGLNSEFKDGLDKLLIGMYEGNENLRADTDAWLANNEGAYDGNVARAVEEVLAEASEGGELMSPTMMDRIRVFLSQWARRLGIKNEGYWGDAEVREILRQAHERIVNGERAKATLPGTRYIRGDKRTPKKLTFNEAMKDADDWAKAEDAAHTYVAAVRKDPVSYSYEEIEEARDWLVTNLYGSDNYLSDELNDHLRLRDWLSSTDDVEGEMEKLADFMIENPEGYFDAMRNQQGFASEIMPMKLLAAQRETYISDPDSLKFLEEMDELYARVDTEYSNNHAPFLYKITSDPDDPTGMNIEYDKRKNIDVTEESNKGFDFRDELGPRPDKDSQFKYMKNSDRTPSKLKWNPGKQKQRGMIGNVSGQRFKSKRAVHPILEEAAKLAPEKSGESFADIDARAREMDLGLEDILEMNKGMDAAEAHAVGIALVRKGEQVERLAGLIARGEASDKQKTNFGEAFLELASIYEVYSDIANNAGRLLASFKIAKQSSSNEALRFMRQDAEQAMANPEGLEDVAAKIARGEKSIGESVKENSTSMTALANALNLPRTLMSSFDLSAPLRQGIVFSATPRFWKSFIQMFRYMGSQEAFDGLQRSIIEHPNYMKAREAGVDFTTIEGQHQVNLEEDFQSEWAKKIPGIGIGVRGSERAFVGFLNKLRMDTFNKYMEDFKRAGVDINDPNILKWTGSFINAATGRGPIPKKYLGATPLLNGLFFSPRLNTSRISLLTPMYWGMAPAPVRKKAIKNMLGFAGAAMTTLSLAALGGADVEMDPRSSDFGKIRVGTKRLDPLGGFGQFITFGSRLLTGETKTIKGDVKTLEPGIASDSRLDVFFRFIRSKLAPVTSFFADAMDGQNMIGERFSVTEPFTSPPEGEDPVPLNKNAVVTRLTPIFMQDLIESIAEDGGEGLPYLVPAVFGIGYSNFDSVPSDSPIRVENNPNSPVAIEIARIATEIDKNPFGDPGKRVNLEGDGEDARVLTDEEYERYVEIADEFIMQDLAPLFERPDYQGASVEEQVEMIKKTVNAARKDARATLSEEYYGDDAIVWDE